MLIIITAVQRIISRILLGVLTNSAVIFVTEVNCRGFFDTRPCAGTRSTKEDKVHSWGQWTLKVQADDGTTSTGQLLWSYFHFFFETWSLASVDYRCADGRTIFATRRDNSKHPFSSQHWTRGWKRDKKLKSTCIFISWTTGIYWWSLFQQWLDCNFTARFRIWQLQMAP